MQYYIVMPFSRNQSCGSPPTKTQLWLTVFQLNEVDYSGASGLAGNMIEQMMNARQYIVL